MKRFPRFLAIGLLALHSLRTLRAEDIDGVQPAALDQPRINLCLRRKPDDLPLVAGAADKSTGATFNIEAFFDTGASGIMLAPNTARALGVKRETVSENSKPVEASFEDVGVGGGDKFAISEPLIVALAPYTPSFDIDDPKAAAGMYTLTFGPVRTQIGPLQAKMDFLTALAMGDLDVVGTPAMRGAVVVLDVRPVNTFSDKIRTYIYERAKVGAVEGDDPRQGVPHTTRHVRLSAVSFDHFTKTSPKGAEPPAMAANPFIGPDPTHPKAPAPAGAIPPVVLTHNGKTTSGSWLLDTGAATSMISRAQAAALGVGYVAGSETTDEPKLENFPLEKQFTMSVAGVGGSKKAAGFYVDSLRLDTREGTPLIYHHAPVLVSDITVQDPATGQRITLDGVFGMNYLVATAKVEGGLLPDLKNMTEGPYKWVVYDPVRSELGLEPSDAVARGR